MDDLGKLLRNYEKDPSNPVARQRYQTALMRTFGYNLPASEIVKEIYRWFDSRGMLDDIHIVGESRNLGESEVEMNKRVEKIIKSRPLNSFMIRVPTEFPDDFFLKGKLTSEFRDMLQLRGWDIEHWHGNSFAVKANIVPMLESFYNMEENSGEIIIGERAQRDFGAFLSEPLELALQKCVGNYHVHYNEDAELTGEKLDEFYNKVEITTWLSSRHLKPRFKEVELEENWMFFVRFLFRGAVSALGSRWHQSIRSDLFDTNDFHAISSTARWGAVREMNLMLRRSQDLNYVSMGSDFNNPYGLIKSDPWVLPQTEGLAISFVFQPNIEMWMELLARERVFSQWD